MTLQLQVAEGIDWWKEIQVFASFFGSWYLIRTLGTKDKKTTATVDLTPGDANSGTLKLEFHRAGFLGIGVHVTSLVIDVPSNLGKKIIFLCELPKDPGE